jgi:hypothetical protein
MFVITVALIELAEGCTATNDADDPVISRMIPSQKDTSQEVAVQIVGRNFFGRVSRNTAGNNKLEVNNKFVARLYPESAADTSYYEIKDVLQIDDESLTGTVSQDIPAGIYSLEVETPLGLSAILTQAFSVEDQDTQGKDSDTFISTDTDEPLDSDLFDTDSAPYQDSDTNHDEPNRMKIVLNTSPTGANITETVYNFPVLIRLDSSTFDFSSADTAGGDLRFYDSQEQDLSFEIEQWDAEANSSAVWVKVPVIYPSDSTQYIVMEWGSNLPSLSAATGVFDVNNDFAGVYHMNMSATGWNDEYLDATANLANGTGIYMDMNAETDGVAGPGVYFNGDDFIRIGGMFGLPVSVMVSGWILTTIGGFSIVDMGNHVRLRIDNYYPNIVFSYFTEGLGIWNTTEADGNVFDGAWHHLVYVVDTENPRQQIFIDGALITEDYYTGPIQYLFDTRDTILGASWDGTSYRMVGSLDEVRIESAPRSESWIKLCYENQRPENQTLVEFR